MNTFKTVALLTILTLIFIYTGRMIGGEGGMVVAFGLAALMNLVAYWYSDRIILAIYRAREVSSREVPRLYQIVASLAKKANLPMPRVYLIPSQTPNAFATGRDPHHAAVAVTDGIMGILNDDELEGVIGHELSHIRNRDVLIGSIVATIAGAIAMLADMARFAYIFGGYRGRDRDQGGVQVLLMAIIAPIVALLIQMMISRSREYKADEDGAMVSGKPLGLANALKKLEFASSRLPMSTSPATAHLFIVNPLRGSGFSTLFSTHPPIEQRVSRLLSLAKKMG